MSEETQTRVRDLANNAWLLLISRAVALLAVPMILAIAAWAYNTDRTVMTNTTSLEAVADLALENKLRIDGLAPLGTDVAVIRAQMDALREQSAERHASVMAAIERNRTPRD